MLKNYFSICVSSVPLKSFHLWGQTPFALDISLQYSGYNVLLCCICTRRWGLDMLLNKIKLYLLRLVISLVFPSKSQWLFFFAGGLKKNPLDIPWIISKDFVHRMLWKYKLKRGWKHLWEKNLWETAKCQMWSLVQEDPNSQNFGN